MEKRELIHEMLKKIEGGRSVAAAYLGMSDIKFNNRLFGYMKAKDVDFLAWMSCWPYRA